MLKITTKEEREQLKNEGIFLEGVLCSQYGSTNLSKITDCSVVSLIFVISLLTTYWTAAENMSWNMLWSLLIEFICLFILRNIIINQMFMLYFKRQVNFLLTKKELYINWVTIVGIDKANRHISYIEDDAVSPDNRRYIVDYIATRKDCRRLVKGERVLILYTCNDKGKFFPLLIKPGPKMQLLSEQKQCGKVYIKGLEHVPHRNAFLMNKKVMDTKNGEFREVIFHSNMDTLSDIINHSKFGAGVFVYEWNGNAFELNYYGFKQIPKCDYGDILLKITDNRDRVFFRKLKREYSRRPISSYK